ncbi:MAG TPA: tRNA (guanosine(46)-N7)-methyltransferase TrmB [Candidatus Binatia bacterium]|nr:tRNA (guanosine(46)-N7)-methyltransferase TrmB [Candidatus Binatia bacterium]
MAENEKSVLVYPRSYVEPLPLAQLFSSQEPLEIELGAGDGSFLAAWTAKKPLHNFLGVERLLGRIRKAERKIQRGGLTNVRLLRIEAGYFLEYLLPPGSVATLHVYFPDPWPKRKHWRHRLINEHFTGIAANALQPGGAVYLRTDDQNYFAQMTEVFGKNSDFEVTTTPPELRAVLTDFERDFQARGVSTLITAYRKR